jgi:S-formylglutathione hydrolase
MAFETTGTIASFGGKLLKLKHKSSSTNTDMSLNLYLPPQALKSGAKVPVLFYLSGLTCTGDNCSEKGFFQHGASEKGIAVVYPDTSPRTLVLSHCFLPLTRDVIQAACRFKARTTHTISARALAST